MPVLDVQPTTLPLVTCQICLDAACVVEQLCGAKCPAAVCNSCLQSYVQAHSAAAISGVLTKLDCPICITPLPLPRWKELVGDDALQRLETKVAASCSTLCPQCHNFSVLLPPTEDTNDTNDDATDPWSEAGLTKLQPLCTEYNRHLRSAAEVYESVVALYETDQRDAMLTRLLPLLLDAERRATLFLHWRRQQPFVFTRCCNQAVCFGCQTKGHHDNVACKSAAPMANDLVECPECRVQLVKGDGCDSITCFCGASFNWVDRLRAYRLATLLPSRKHIFKRVLFLFRARRQKRQYTIFVVSQIPSFVLQQKLLFITYNFFCPSWHRFRRSLLVLVHRRRANHLARQLAP
ncbi:hypothetical protein SDRG_00651 [Saprolegnia diclina VS20]|uniref:RING-type domain-containing protein n=1 Tax=Saprolegnia diclina (strain VS20) TaxID=1156394 RepID=T0S901_SAPDV|nr:hypothetical protein SDRG_00651 [Saprolegnia diclina VS20]EQC41788.1 hypothetical protein SDRG_00651 [Saprolegnia diclina VS20]|eukprot:XP_008604357.1 hypothetical protein SDRG_00651 [Saprolegnia diclina VS20]